MTETEGSLAQASFEMRAQRSNDEVVGGVELEDT